MALIHITTCILCHDRAKAFRLEEPGFEAPSALGNGSNIPITTRLQEFQLKLLAHIQKAAEWERKALERAMKLHIESKGPQPDPRQTTHYQAWQEFAARTACAQGTAIMQAFETSDPALNAMREACRLRLNSVTRKFYFTDAMILEGVQKLNFDPETQDVVLKFCIQMRDALLEQGQYAPVFGEAAAVRTAK